MKTYILSVVLIIFTAYNAFAQEEDDNIGTEVINVVKPYAPSVSDAFKVKETPVVNDSTALQKKKIDYTIFSVPVASTFTPSKGKAAGVEKQAPQKLYDNYASLGLGNYLNVLGDLYLTHAFDKNSNVSLGLNHHSTQGEIKDVQLDDKFYDTNLNIGYQKRDKDLSYQVNGLFAHQQYNWFGTSYDLTDAQRANIDASHTYLTGGLSASVAIDNSIFKGGSFEYIRFWDDQNANENHLNIKPNFEIEIADKDFDLGVNVDYLGGVFDITNLNEKFGHLEIGLHPSYAFEVNDLSLKLGVQTVFSNNVQQDKTELLIYPKLKASYPIIDNQINVFAGIDGGTTDNSYRSLAQENKYLAPILNIVNTHTLYDAFLGVEGKVAEKIQFTLKASYKNEDHKALFMMNPVNDVTLVTENFEKVNTFGIVYDEVSTASFYGKVTADINKNNTIGLSATYSAFSLDTQDEAWNIPNLKANLFGNFKFTDKLSGGVDLFYVGERKDVLQSNTILVAPALATLDDYMDVNLHVDYQVTPRFTAFLKGNNLASENYQKYLSYPVQQIQILGGISYKFDF